ncbi:reverse transcriptase family protein [Agrobacterium rosae]
MSIWVLLGYLVVFSLLSPKKIDVQYISEISGAPPKIVASLAWGEGSRYRTYSLSKKSGGTRTISVPLPTLLKIQRAIKLRLLDDLPLHDAAKGFRKGHNIKDHVTPHLKSRDFAKIDLLDCFPSIKDFMISGLFRSLGYRSADADLLAHLLTDQGCLPQGAATSPALCNLILHEMDQILSQYCLEKGLIFTRYADDILISGSEINLHTYNEILLKVNELGFQTNKKSRLMHSPQKLVVCGISIASGETKLPRPAKRSVRTQSHNLLNHPGGLMGYFLERSERGEVDPFFADRLLGKLDFWSFVEPSATLPRDHARRLRSMLADI